ncbi:MAG: hypothetical protein JNL82_26765 [Myxococcales bacterium]|nr:hypothetical protein [Myxococcales bacterium]
MSPARARSLALAVALGVPSLARAQSPSPSVPAPTVPLSTAPTPAPAPPDPTSEAPLAAPTPVDVAPTPPPPAEAAPTPAPTPAPSPAPPVARAEVITSTAPAYPVEVVPPLPRLSLTAGFVFGPHAKGEATCQDIEGGYQCEHTGNFLGVGGTVELRAQLYRVLFLHARGLLVGNVRSRGAHSGLAGAGLGLGAYSRFAFIRGEYLLVPTLGSDNYRPPFYAKPAGKDEWNLHAGMISGGVRRYVSNRASLEAWVGVVIGPRARRTSLSADAAENRVLISFMASLGFTFDLLLAKGYVPGEYKRRPRRQWGTR